MSEENKSYDEIQSKTVLLEDNEGVNDMLSALNTGRAAMDKRKKDLERAKMIKTVSIIGIIIISVAVALFLLMK